MIGHIAFVTDRMENTQRFFKELFGYESGFTLYDAEERPWIEYLVGPDGTFIELFYTAAAASSTSESAYAHLCIETRDIHAIVENACRLNIPLYKPLKTGLDDNLQCWFMDPNGLRIEVMQMSDQSPQMKLRRKLGLVPNVQSEIG